MPNDKAQMPNQGQNPNHEKKYDLEERTAQFGEAIIELVKTFPRDPVNSPLISQVVRAGTSVGANQVEADGAESKTDFQHKISICKKESKETRHWLRMIVKANPGRRDDCQKLLREAQELSLIFSSILLSKKKQL
jgi:four helix bundle protein